MIDTQAIRSKILNLAMRGQLTEQLPEDGTAEELYQQILVEKQALVKAGKIRKEKPLPDIAPKETPFEIPANWKWARIGEVFTLQSGKNIATGSIKDRPDDENKYPCYGGNGLRGYVDSFNVTGCHALIGRQGALCGNINFADGDFYATEHAVVVYQYARTDTQWAGLTLRALNLNQYATSVAQPGLAVNKIDKVLIPLPPLAEQQRIVEKIGQAFSVLDTIDALQARHAGNLAALRAKLIDAAIRGQLTEQLPQDGTAEELYQQIQAEKQALIKAGKIRKEKPLPEVTPKEAPFDIPANWKWVKLGNIARVLGGKRIPVGRSLTKEDTGHKYIRVSDMKNRTVQTDNLLFVPEDIFPSISQYIINKEDVYITVAGTIGRVGKIPPEIDGANLTENADRIVFSHIDQDWLITCLSATAIQKQIELLTTSVAQPKLAIKRIQEFLIPLAPLAEQQRIVARLDEVLKVLEA